MGDDQDIFVIVRQQLLQFGQQLLPEPCIEGAERFIEKEDIRFIDEAARQGRPLLLPSRKLSRLTVRKAGQVHPSDHIIDPPLSLPFILEIADTTIDIFLYRHMGKQGVILEQIAYMTVLNAHIRARTGIEQDAAVEHDPPGIGSFDTGNALQGLALAASGSAEDAEDTAPCFKMDRQGKGAQLLFYMDRQAHRRRLLSRPLFSYTLIVSSTTALIAILMRTQINAWYSSLVRQS